MCIASAIGDNFRDRHWPNWPVEPFQPVRRDDIDPLIRVLKGMPVSREEFDALVQEVRSLRELMEKAVEHDKLTGQPDCDQAEKVALLKQIGKALGVDFDSILNGS